MVSTNGKTRNTRAKEEGFHNYPHPNGSRNVGYQSEGIGNQQERINRADSAELSYFAARGTVADTRAATSGGTITQLIEDTQQQIAASEAHTTKLQRHLQTLFMLRDRLGQTQEE